mmetsp:Transcript_146952/g.259723  ORF Transcript_146952/g.259723 Transcript_146952/m.259723 type:complete len:308 (-) Transcript_146952:1676-2599(-)
MARSSFLSSAWKSSPSLSRLTQKALPMVEDFTPCSATQASPSVATGVVRLNWSKLRSTPRGAVNDLPIAAAREESPKADTRGMAPNAVAPFAERPAAGTPRPIAGRAATVGAAERAADGRAAPATDKRDVTAERPAAGREGAASLVVTAERPAAGRAVVTAERPTDGRCGINPGARVCVTVIIFEVWRLTAGRGAKPAVTDARPVAGRARPAVTEDKPTAGRAAAAETDGAVTAERPTAGRAASEAMRPREIMDGIETPAAATEAAGANLVAERAGFAESVVVDRRPREIIEGMDTAALSKPKFTPP